MNRPRVHRLRRVSQAAFLAAFLVLLTLTVWPLGQVFFGAFLVADPLIALNSAADGSFKWPMLVALGMLALPLLLGRVFCGYACPTGALLEWTTPSQPAKEPGRPRRFRAPRLPEKVRGVLRLAPPLILLLCAGLLLFASSVYLLLDPIAALTRTATVLLYPLIDRLVRLAGDVGYLLPPARPAVDAVDAFLQGRIVFARPLTFGLQGFVLGWAVALVAASRLEPRLWCRHLCPLGALLGLVGRFSLFGRVVDSSKCTRCGRCERVCPLGAIADGGTATDTSRCQLGLECADECPNGAIRFGWRPRRVTYSPSRRAMATGLGASMLIGFFAYTGLKRYTRDPSLVRPPGAPGERDVLALCTRCGQCMKVCPTNVIQPSLVKSGIEGVFTPEMDYRVAFCDWACNECGKVCPTGAIAPLDLATKRKTRIGRAYIDKNRCIPWADYKTCIVCQELCPIPDKAIALREVEVADPLGKTVKLQRPEVIADRCIGCGVCQNACPVVHESAITVRAIEPERRG